jgi:hypothetical protein
VPTSRVLARPSAPTRPGAPAHHRRRPARPFVIAAAHRTPPQRMTQGRAPRPLARRRFWIAAVGAAFSLVLVCTMTLAVVMCAGGACRVLRGPAPARAELTLDQQLPMTPSAPVTPGRPPTATPAR